MWYTTKVGPDFATAAMEFVVHIINIGTEHCKALGRLIGYIKVKETKVIIIRKSKVLNWLCSVTRIMP